MIMTKNSTERRVVKFDLKEEKKLDYTERYRYKEVKLDSSKIDLCYMLIHLEMISNEFKVSHKDTLMMLYLYELGLFSALIELDGVNVRVCHLESYGFIEEDYYNGGKKLYSLSAKGIIFVRDFMNRISNNNGLINKNRKTLLDNDSRVKSVINRYFNS